MAKLVKTRASWFRPAIMLLMLAALLPGRAKAQFATVRSGTWNQPSGEGWLTGELINLQLGTDGALRIRSFAQGLSSVGSFTTAPTRVEWPFSHLAARWQADVPAGTWLAVELRARLEGSQWTAWSPLYDPQSSDSPLGPANRLATERGIYGENILALDGAQWMQARFTLVSTAPNQSPVLRGLSLIYIDATEGPTASQAAAATRAMGHSHVGSLPQPQIISRAAWGADESWMTWPPEYTPVEKIVVHHTVSENDEPDPAATVRAIYYYHAIVRGWGDIGYNLLVDRFGNIYEGRSGGADVIGGHTYGYNAGTLGIGSLGTFGNAVGSVQPTADMIASLAEIAAWTSARHLIHPTETSTFGGQSTYNIAGHRDYGTTACPGDLLYADLQVIRDSAWTLLESTLPAYAAGWVANSTPTNLLPGSTVQVTAAVQNSGILTWPIGGSNPVRLGYHWFDAAGMQVVQPPEDDHRTLLLEETAFGSAAEMSNALLTAPDVPGTYTLRWDMVHEGVTWFADQGNPTFDVTVHVAPISSQVFLPVVVRQRQDQAPPPTPPPSPCMQLIVNGGFETDEGWVLNDTPADAHYTSDQVHAGARALRAGIEPSGGNLYSYSSADQEIQIPGDATGITLSLWHFSTSADSGGDFQYLMVRDQGGGWHTLLSQLEDDETWRYHEVDLSAFAGQAVTLRVGAFNDGTQGVTSFSVDEVNVLSCP